MDNESAHSGGQTEIMGGGGFGGGNTSENYSPFKPPNEEQVFITREAEK